MQEVVKTVLNASGIHARPAALFVNEAKKFSSKVTITNLNLEKSADAKFILRVMTLCLTKGTQVKITAEGEDEAEAVKVLGELIDSGLGEEI